LNNRLQTFYVISCGIRRFQFLFYITRLILFLRCYEK
jgi:hypothetical protein